MYLSLFLNFVYVVNIELGQSAKKRKNWMLLECDAIEKYLWFNGQRECQTSKYSICNSLTKSIIKGDGKSHIGEEDQGLST